ncbi:major capsid protein [Photobacterium damselae subsp. damselae]|uniref:major capsid protein n=1 Tax=Photobacterium damselae TaxID=38293 RepID=UPI00311AC86B
MKDSVRIAMLQALEMTMKPTGFLTSLAQCPDSNITNSKKVKIDVLKNDRRIAVDVIAGAGGYANSYGRYKTSDYTPPEYNEYGWVYAEDMNRAKAAETEYNSSSFVAQVLKQATPKQVLLYYKIQRAIEKQAADALFTGKIVLINGDVLDFNRNPDHTFIALSSWGVDDDLDVDLERAVSLNKTNGYINSDYALLGSTAMARLLTNNKAQKKLNTRSVKRGDICWPSAKNDGAIYHGRYSTVNYSLDLFTYPQDYTVPKPNELPTGILLPNAGQTVPYIPEDGVFVGSTKARFDLLFAGVPSVGNTNEAARRVLGVTRMPIMRKGKVIPYSMIDTCNEALKVGVKSRPLWVPTQVDAGAAFTLK